MNELNGYQSKVLEILSEIKDEVHQIDKDVIQVKETQKHHYDLNQTDHNNMVSMITSIQDELKSLQEVDAEQDKTIAQAKGAKSMLGWIIASGIALLAAVGTILAIFL